MLHSYIYKTAADKKVSYSCLMLELSNEIIKGLQDRISTEDLYTAEDGHGLETDAHCTVLYGLHTKNDKVIGKLLSMQPLENVELEIEEASLFTNEKYDVLKFSVKSKHLRALNNLFKILPHTNSYTTYSPHITVAYLKPGKGSKYVGIKPGVSKTTSSRFCFSTPEKVKTYFDLSTGIRKLSEIDEDTYMAMNFASLAAARIRASQSQRAYKALEEAKLTTPDKMLDIPYWDKVKLLNTHGYARYDESRARFLEHNAKLVKDKYKGNLAQLLKLPKEEIRKRIQEFKGIGPKGAEIFLAGIETLRKNAEVTESEELKPHQKRVVEKIKHQNGLVVAHEPGSGKTRTSIEVYKALGLPAEVVVPAALKSNYHKELKKWIGSIPKDVKIKSQQLISRNGEVSTKHRENLLIVDEGHKGRNPESKLNKALREHHATKRLVLTGTPIYNHPSDIASLVNLAADATLLPEDRQSFEERFVERKKVHPGFLASLMGVSPGNEEALKNKHQLKAILSKYVDFEPINQKDFPTSAEEVYKVPMTSAQRDIYESVIGRAPFWLKYKIQNGLPPNKAELSKLQHFMTGLRQVSNTSAGFVKQKGLAESPKINKAVQLLKEKLKDPSAKAIVYSNFLESGIDPYKEQLEKNRIPYGEFSGRISDDVRQQSVKDYNLDKLRVLLLSSAGGEGLDLKNTGLVQLLDPHFNLEKQKQIIGRAIRLGSHSSLPPEKRNVVIQRFLATLPPNRLEKIFSGKGPKGSDEYLADMSERKDRLNRQMYEILKHGEEAKGIPNRAEYGEVTKLEPYKIYDYVQQLHKAKRRGEHIDFRIGNKELGMFSWVLSKPLSNEKQPAIQTQVHTHSYKDFEGEIPKGEYGAGTVEKLDEGKVLVTDVTPNKINFSVVHKKHPERYTLLNPHDGRIWSLFRRKDYTESGAEKKHYKSIKEKNIIGILKDLRKGSSVQPKIDGALSTVNIKDKKVELLSHRISKVTGKPVIQTERVLGGIPKVDSPNAVLLGETYGVYSKTDNAVPLQTLGGILNSSVYKALKDTADKGINLRTMLFDIAKYKGKDVSDLPYEKRKELLHEVYSKLPSDKFHLPEEAHTPNSAIELYKQLKSGKHPYTTEGLVIHPPTGTPMKMKFFPENDVYITGTFKAEKGSKYEGNAVGGFTYSLSPNRKTIGRIGTGISDEVRKDAYQNPEKYTDRWARIRSHGQFDSGVHRVPVFLALHESKSGK